MYNPLELTDRIETQVTKGTAKKYYRFRPTRFYGGIATADTVGCNLRCKFCWSSNSVWKSSSIGTWYTSKEIADKLQSIAAKHEFTQVRISGGEPTIGKDHLVNVLKHCDASLRFILETNGILIGSDKSYVNQLGRFSNLYIRVCLKGCSPEEFSLLTGAKTGFNHQLKALTYLADEHLPFHLALVSGKNDNSFIQSYLHEHDLDHLMIEKEEIKLYPQVKKRLLHENLIDYFK